MRRRAVTVVATQGISPVMAMLVALVIALILLLAAPVKAQETTAEETTVLAADAADRKVEAETDNVSAEVDNGKVSVSTDDGSSSDDGTSQQSSLTVQQNQTDEGSQSRASTGDVNIGATRRNNSNARVEVDVLDENGNRTGDNFTANGGNDVTETVPEGDGFFSLDIRADNASYNIRVEDCDPNCNNPDFVRTFTGRDDQRTDDFEIFGNSFRLRIETDRVDGNNNNNRNRRHHDRDRNRRHHRHHDRDRHNNRFFGGGAAHQQYRSERIVEERVIRETIPNKGTLANTGGVPLTGAAFLALASVGLGVSILRFAVRRDQ
jgi:hypothetical protein